MVFLRRDKRMYNGDSSELLNSWKEIAAYLHRGVRTVQRWESELGLPVRRPRGRSRSAVMAMRSELDEWIKACPVNGDVGKNGHVAPPTLFATTEMQRLNSLLLQSHELHTNAYRLRTEVRATLGTLVDNLKKLSVETFPRAGSASNHRS